MSQANDTLKFIIFALIIYILYYFFFYWYKYVYRAYYFLEDLYYAYLDFTNDYFYAIMAGYALIAYLLYKMAEHKHKENIQRDLWENFETTPSEQFAKKGCFRRILELFYLIEKKENSMMKKILKNKIEYNQWMNYRNSQMN